MCGISNTGVLISSFGGVGRLAKFIDFQQTYSSVLTYVYRFFFKLLQTSTNEPKTLMFFDLLITI